MLNVEKMIRDAAKSQGLSVSKMAMRAEINPAQISNVIKRGNMQLSSIIRLAEALNIPVSEFVKYGEK